MLIRTEPSPESDARALAWMLHWIEELGEELELLKQRIERYVEDARALVAADARPRREHRERCRTLPQRIAALLGVLSELADEPVLYQRWWGMRIINGLRDLDWQPEGDFVGAP